MKRIITSTGLLVAGIAGLQAANTAGLTPLESSKFWNVSAALRGFYDDNITTLPDDLPGKTSTWGIEVMPSVSLNFPMDMTYVGVAYNYTYRYYTESVFSKNSDQTHEVKLKVDHKFSDRFRLNFNDSFVYTSEPEIFDGNISTPIRTDSEGVRNHAILNFNAQLTELLGLEAGYQNSWYHYLQDGTASRAALLNRLEHLFHLDVRYQARENLVGLFGYQFGLADYDGNDPLYFANALNPFPPNGDIRDSTTHYVYVGAETVINDKLNVAGKVGAQYTDFGNAHDSSWSPYADLSATYSYLPGSFVKFGFKNVRSATDVAYNPIFYAGQTPTLDQELSLVYLMVNHQITPQFSGNLSFQYQNSRFNNGVADGQTEDFFSFGAHFAYKFNMNWSTELGYIYDNLDSGVTFAVRDFSRNRVYLGVRATY